MSAAADAYEELRMHDALEAALAIANRGNLYMEEVAPWTAFKKVPVQAVCILDASPANAPSSTLQTSICTLWLHCKGRSL